MLFVDSAPLGKTNGSSFIYFIGGHDGKKR